ncbi:hypothetical protein G5I_06866 [Acromyrmex echinatior]|uniref:Uncharacterized protein n=1 Tax=Acromyrmex echinatior TaxID=103372 RepID=F4WM33_ACREC|nr:hypothetical protein G5I_06866 [Acromyrmex echinatior]
MMESIITTTKSFVSSDSRSPKGRAVSQSVSQSIRFTHARASADAYLPDDHVTKNQKKKEPGQKRLRLTSVSSYFADTPSGVCDIRRGRPEIGQDPPKVLRGTVTVSSENPKPLPTSFDAATSKQMPSRASATALGIISTFDIGASRDNPIGRRAAGSTGGGKCRRTHVPVSSGYRRERERESVFISPSAQILPNRH